MLASTRRILADPYDILAHYALGDMPGYTAGEGSRVEWLRRQSHRGVHLLASIAFPRSQRRYVFAGRFELRFDAAFEEVVRACADRPRTWLVSELIEGFCKLHRMGFAHSYETWQDGRLVGGCFGVHIGAYASIESCFHRVSHASKAAYGRTLLHLEERGFLLVDSNPVKDASRNYGEEWLPQWKFEGLLRHAIERPVALTDGEPPPPPLPAKVRRILPLARTMRKFARRVSGHMGPRV
ncbi:MAG TPA: leucyl/phenylalanyl-tRNA--protein transferase [Tepidisphaeraceae bacterium]